MTLAVILVLERMPTAEKAPSLRRAMSSSSSRAFLTSSTCHPWALSMSTALVLTFSRRRMRVSFFSC